MLNRVVKVSPKASTSVVTHALDVNVGSMVIAFTSDNIRTALPKGRYLFCYVDHPLQEGKLALKLDFNQRTFYISQTLIDSFATEVYKITPLKVHS